jgi:hypothetical protein
MRRESLSYLWRTKRFLFRLLASYFLVPLVPSLLMQIHMQHVSSFLVLLYYFIGLIAMIALGTPLLFCFLQLSWSGFIPFLVGAGVCAGITSVGLLGPSPDLFQV